jgi:hypothetical protein
MTLLPVNTYDYGSRRRSDVSIAVGV